MSSPRGLSTPYFFVELHRVVGFRSQDCTMPLIGIHQLTSSFSLYLQPFLHSYWAALLFGWDWIWARFSQGWLDWVLVVTLYFPFWVLSSSSSSMGTCVGSGTWVGVWVSMLKSSLICCTLYFTHWQYGSLAIQFFFPSSLFPFMLILPQNLLIILNIDGFSSPHIMQDECF